MSPRVDSVAFFDALADEMNSHPEQYEVLGDIDLDLALVMRDAGGDFGARLHFNGIRCDGVSSIEAGEEAAADCWLDGDLTAWQTMFDDIFENGRATGRQTINSLTLLGEVLTVNGADPLGVDKFFRFNQTVQAFLDGAAKATARADA